MSLKKKKNWANAALLLRRHPFERRLSRFLTTWCRLCREKAGPCWEEILFDQFWPQWAVLIDNRVYHWCMAAERWDTLAELPVFWPIKCRGVALGGSGDRGKGGARSGSVSRLISRCHSDTVGFRREGQPGSTQESAGSLGKTARKKKIILKPYEQWNRPNKACERSATECISHIATLTKLLDDTVQIRGSRYRAVSLSRQDTSGEGRKKLTDCNCTSQLSNRLWKALPATHILSRTPPRHRPEGRISTKTSPRSKVVIRRWK